MNKTETLYPNRLATQRWKRFNCAMEKQYIYSKPTQASIAYINDKDEAHVGVIDLTAPSVITQDVLIGPALDVSIAYDARWRLTGTDEYDMYTIGEPYIAYVDTAKNLYVRRGLTGSTLNLASGVSRCWIVRGWKHITDPIIDQGLIVFYLKGNQLYSRSYVQQDATKYSWLTEEVYQAGAVVDIQAYRTTDFRLAIACTQTTGTSRLLLTSRVFPGQSIPAETFNATISNEQAIYDIRQIEYTKAYGTEYFNSLVGNFGEHIIFFNPTSSDTQKYGSAYNVGNTQIVVSIPQDVQKLEILDRTCIAVSDESNMTYATISIEKSDNNLLLIVGDMGNCTTDIILEYESGLMGPNNQAVKPFTIKFTPLGLKPTPPNPPTVVKIWNVSSEVI